MALSGRGVTPGTPRLHERGFARGRARLAALDFVPSPESDVAGFPYLLITGRVLQHYNVGTMTRRTPSLELAPRDLLEIHPDDADREGVDDGAEVGVESRWGSCRARVRLSDARVAGNACSSRSTIPETHTNRVIGPFRDPRSDCPEYKLTSVRLTA